MDTSKPNNESENLDVCDNPQEAAAAAPEWHRVSAEEQCRAAEAFKVDERRRSVRTAARHKGRIEVSGYSFPVLTWDVSMGGARCSVQGVFPKDTQCTLYLDDGSGNEVGLPCKTVRSTGFDTRVSFVNLKSSHKDFLTALTSKFTGC